jgi:hypothetical protein
MKLLSVHRKSCITITVLVSSSSYDALSTDTVKYSVTGYQWVTESKMVVTYFKIVLHHLQEKLRKTTKERTSQFTKHEENRM